jgi:hypothetical protein
MRAEELMDRYREEITALRRADAAGIGDAGVYAATWASFTCGFMFGAGLPAAAATAAHLFRRAYPGTPFPVLWEGEDAYR